MGMWQALQQNNVRPSELKWGWIALSDLASTWGRKTVLSTHTLVRPLMGLSFVHTPYRNTGSYIYNPKLLSPLHLAWNPNRPGKFYASSQSTAGNLAAARTSMTQAQTGALYNWAMGQASASGGLPNG